MQPAAMDRLIEQHLKAELGGDPSGCVAMYTDDIVHDVVCWPSGPAKGTRAAQSFYEHLVKEIHGEEIRPVKRYYGPDFAVVEHLWTGTVPGSFLGVPVTARRSPSVFCTSGNSETAA